MIIIKLQGGLGNQLFQYALGRTIETKYKKEVKYDVATYREQGRFTQRFYLLNKFKTMVTFASDEEIIKAKNGAFNYFTRKALNKFFFKKYNISYDPVFFESLKTTDSAYLEGYWQSIRYVEPCIEDLRKEISLKDEMSQVLNEKIEEVSKSASVAIHIRRGDYLNAGVDLSVLDISYYKKANDYASQRLNNLKYYIFTDDVRWAKENLHFLGKDNVIFISDLGMNDYEELLLMASCKNVIIANSSFSWWGAMLNQNKDAIIVCPKDWRNKFIKNDDNLCPKEWVRI